MAAELHPRSGKLIGLSNSNRTARRNQPVQEFNHGLVLSKEPLRDRDVFTVRIDKKVNNSRPAAAAAAERGESNGNAGLEGRAGGLFSVRSEGLLSVSQGGSYGLTASTVVSERLVRRHSQIFIRQTDK